MGPGLAGALVGTLGAPFALLVDALSFLVSALFLRGIRVAERRRARAGDRPGVLTEIAEGLRMVADDRVLRVLAGCSATTTCSAACSSPCTSCS